MGTIILKPHSDIDLTQSGAWDKVHSSRTFAEYLSAVDNDRAFIKADSATALSSGTLGLSMTYDNTSVTLPNAFTIQAIRMVGTTGDIGDSVTEGKIKGTFLIGSDIYDFDFKAFSMGSPAENYSVDTITALPAKVYHATDFNTDNLRLNFYGQAQQLKSGKTGSRYRLEIDSVNLEVDYTEVEIPDVCYIKHNGDWTACVPYKKIDGVWVQQEPNFLGQSNISQAYHKGG